MKNKKSIKEAKSLRWLATQFPIVVPEDELDKMSNAINVYCTAGADKIEELAEMIDKLTEENNELKRKLSGYEVIDND